jgi:hypothetical protein
VQVTPDGHWDTLSWIAVAVPLVSVTWTAEDVLPPKETVAELGMSEIEKVKLDAKLAVRVPGPLTVTS